MHCQVGRKDVSTAALESVRNLRLLSLRSRTGSPSERASGAPSPTMSLSLCPYNALCMQYAALVSVQGSTKQQQILPLACSSSQYARIVLLYHLQHCLQLHSHHPIVLYTCSLHRTTLLECAPEGYGRQALPRSQIVLYSGHIREQSV